ncbi:2-hydroxyacid dehydrogenase [Pseudaminobacter soli (ex Zhang et al. 2022)]
MKQAIILVEPMLDEIEARLDESYDVHRLGLERDRARIEAKPQAIRAVVTGGGTGLSREWFDRLAALGLVAINGVGTDKVDLELARSRGIHVSTTPGVLADDVADMGMALILGVLRRVTEGDRFMRRGDWASGGKPALGASLKGRRLGILGLGQIGRALGRRAETFGMRISYWNRSVCDGQEAWKKFGSPVELAAACDVLAVCVAATPQTEKIVGRDVLAALGPSGLLVNVARGSVVDEDALIAALKGGVIAGAGLDVFVNEPKIRSEFMALDNVLLSPHQGSATVETRRAMGEIVLANLAAYFAGATPPTSVP